MHRLKTLTQGQVHGMFLQDVWEMALNVGLQRWWHVWRAEIYESSDTERIFVK